MATSTQRLPKKRSDHSPSNGEKQSLVAAQWSGPIPPPSTLRGFDDVVPGAAERILRMAELEQQHRHINESALVTADEKAVRRGHNYGLCATIAALGACLVSIWMQAHWSVSIALVSLPIGAIVKDLINGRR